MPGNRLLSLLIAIAALSLIPNYSRASVPGASGTPLPKVIDSHGRLLTNLFEKWSPSQQGRYILEHRNDIPFHSCMNRRQTGIQLKSAIWNPREKPWTRNVQIGSGCIGNYQALQVNFCTDTGKNDAIPCYWESVNATGNDYYSGYWETGMVCVPTGHSKPVCPNYALCTTRGEGGGGGGDDCEEDDRCDCGLTDSCEPDQN